ncbi:MAG: hypothetical protein HPM95_00035 [Alphaproteobacteria bacterium]|nr:hypothetical protein [Alphaproteobacteria bacterium]
MLVHQAQAFTYHVPLERNRRYPVALDWHANPDRDDRLVLRGRVRDDDGTLLQEFTADIVLYVNRKGTPRERRAVFLHGRRPAAGWPSTAPSRLRHQRLCRGIGDRNPIHLDEFAARGVGLPGTIVHGMLVMGQFEAMLRAWRPGV